eukprot:2379254-Amphidinium_carterae.2
MGTSRSSSGRQSAGNLSLLGGGKDRSERQGEQQGRLECSRNIACRIRSTVHLLRLERSSALSEGKERSRVKL